LTQAISRFLHNKQAQDLAEYCLLTALVALIALGIFWRASGGMKDLWGNANTTISTSQPNGSASTSNATASTPTR
jgi:Flp pilus assembly pilin Flp